MMQRTLFKAAAAIVAMAFATSAAMAEGAKIIVVGGKPDDIFWSKVKKGAEDGSLIVKATGGSVTWLGVANYENLGPDAAKLIRTALSQHPSAIVAADWVPEAMDEALKEVVAAHVPLMLFNSGGIEAAKRVGALNYIGSDEYAAGQAGGEYFGTHAVKNVICINTFPGAAFSEARCKGVADGIAKNGGKSSQLPLPSSSFGNPTAVTQAVKAALQKDSSIEGVITLGVQDANSAGTAISQAGVGDKVKLGSFDIDTNALQAIKAHKQLFAIDQQPYTYGVLTVVLLNGYVNYGLDLPTKPVLTGPSIVDVTNVDAALVGAKAGAR
jgi:simple sugar transport system substrate-binding protein